MESRPTLVQVPPSSILPAPGRVHPSRWRSFRAFPLIGQVTIWFAVVLSALVGVGIVGAIAAGPKSGPPAVAAVEGSAAPTTTAPAATTTTTVAATTVVATTAPTTLVAPTVAAAIPLTATVVDGDTITMSDGTTVRLIGIDTPERGQCGYEDSSATIAQLIGGQYVTLVPGARDDIDRYGRLLRYVEVNGVDVDLAMIESGHAIARYDGRDGYGVHPRQDEYVHADALTSSTNLCAPAAVAPASIVPFAGIPVAPAPATTAAPAGVYYQNCTAVRAAGAAPIRAGDPGWQPKFDRDGDGVGCE